MFVIKRLKVCSRGWACGRVRAGVRRFDDLSEVRIGVEPVMLKGLFIAQVNLRAVTGSYGTKGHAHQQLEIQSTEAACKVYGRRRAREEGR